MAVWIIGIALKALRFGERPAGVLAVVAVLSATTALPWLASELLTDIFAGLAVLAFHTLVWHGSKIGLRQRIALLLFIAFAASTHSGTYAVVLSAAAAGALAFRPWASFSGSCFSRGSALIA